MALLLAQDVNGYYIESYISYYIAGHYEYTYRNHMDGLVQERRDSIANARELRLTHRCMVQHNNYAYKYCIVVVCCGEVPTN